MRGDYWLFFAALILIISLATHQVPLVLISLLFLLTGSVSRLWNRFCLHRIEYRRRLSHNQVFFGEEIVFEVEITNRKPLPLPWLQVDDELPEQVTLLKGKATIMHDDRVMEKLGIPSQQFFGDIRLKRHLFQDPVLTAGVRDYHSGDSLKRIHWKSTARLGKLQTKVYEPTTTVDMSIFLDVRTLRAPLWGSVYQLQELGIIAAASISQHALKGGFRVGLYVNQITRFSRGMVRVPHSQHPDQLPRILEVLAQLHQVETVPVARFIQQEARSLPWGSTLVVVSAQPLDELLATLLDLKRVGRSVALVKVGGEKPEVSSGNLPVYHITDDVAWDLVKEIGLEEA